MTRRVGARTRTVIRDDGRRGSGRQRMWQSMRILRRFTIGDIAATAEMSASAVRTFLRALVLTGYLRTSKLTVPGKRGCHLAYQLLRDTGPFPPRVQADGQVWDANQHKLYPPEVATDE